MKTTRKALPIFLAKGTGIIINIASAAGLYGSRGGAALFLASDDASFVNGAVLIVGRGWTAY